MRIWIEIAKQEGCIKIWVHFFKYNPSFDFMGKKPHVQASGDFYILHIFPLTCIILLRRNYNPAPYKHFSNKLTGNWKKKVFFLPKYGLSFPLNYPIWSKSGRLQISWTINSRKFQNWKIYTYLIHVTAVVQHSFVKISYFKCN